jgi:hypothetical protein
MPRVPDGFGHQVETAAVRTRDVVLAVGAVEVVDALDLADCVVRVTVNVFASCTMVAAVPSPLKPGPSGAFGSGTSVHDPAKFGIVCAITPAARHTTAAAPIDRRAARAAAESPVPHDRVVEWLRTWATETFRPWPGR